MAQKIKRPIRRIRARAQVATGRKASRGLAFISFFLLGLGFTQNALATGFVGVSAGAGYQLPLGAQFQTLNAGVGVQAATWLDLGVLDPNWMLFHVAANYQSLGVKNQATMNFNLGEFYAGVQFSNGKFTQSFTPYISLLIGGAASWLSLTSAAGSLVNSSGAFAAQVIPGFDLPIYGRFGATLEMPVRALFFRTSLFLWSPTLSVRFKL